MIHDKPPLVRPAFGRRAAVAFLVLLPFVVHGLWDLVEARRLRARIDAIAASGAPMATRRSWQLSAPAAEADRYYRAAAALLTGVRIKTARPDEYADALAYVDRATDLPFEGFAPGTSYSYLSGDMVSLMLFCERRAIDRAERGDADGAFASLASAARLTRTHPWATTPRLESVRRVVTQATPSAAARARTVRAFADIDRPNSAAESLMLNRALLLEQLSSDEVSSRRPRIDDWLWRPWTDHLAVRRLDEYAALLADQAPPSRDAMTDSLVAMWGGLQKRQAMIHCEHHLVAGASTVCN